MLELVDTHCHIQSVGQKVGERSTREMWAKSELKPDDVVSGANQAGVNKLICVGCDLDDSRLAIEFARQHQGCYASIGLHPHEAKLFAGQSDKLKSFTALATDPHVVAVGECGLDFYYSHSPKEAQIGVLKFQIELALERDLPMIFHVREAFDDFWPIFDKYDGVKGVLHSYTDNSKNLQEAVKRGLYIGVNGIATFAKDPSQLDVYKSIPLDNLLLETDAPFLTPTPYRGSVNEPKRLGAVADFLAKLRDETLADLAQATTYNAQKLFGLKS